MKSVNPVIVLGMHRSGTSCLTGCLEESGLFLGNVNTQAAVNAKGNRENEKIMRLHDRILARVGASWDHPPRFDPIWTDKEICELKEIVKDYQEKSLWGLKDPRAMFMMAGWRSISTPKFVGTFRHPNEVVSSLMFRARSWNQDMSEEKALTIWEAYNRRMLSHYNDKKFDIIRYDVPLDIYQTNIDTICGGLGLKKLQASNFRENRLHNQKTNAKAVPRKVESLWKALNAAAL